MSDKLVKVDVEGAAIGGLAERFGKTAELATLPCGAPSPGRAFNCTRPLGHEGFHQRLPQKIIWGDNPQYGRAEAIRNSAKIFGFALDAGLNKQNAQTLLDTFKKTYPEVEKYIDFVDARTSNALENWRKNLNVLTELIDYDAIKYHDK